MSGFTNKAQRAARRERALQKMQQQLEDGSLHVRQATPEERASWPAPRPAQRRQWPPPEREPDELEVNDDATA